MPTTKIVYNACYGGFSLSRAAIELGRELSNDPNWGENYYELPRTDPTLVQVVEQLGEKANGSYANLKIALLPQGARYRIDEYDGNESVMTPDDYEWLTA